MDQHLTMTDHVTAVCAACIYHLYALPNNRSRENGSKCTRHLSTRLLQLTVAKHPVITDSSATSCPEQCSQANNTHQ